MFAKNFKRFFSTKPELNDLFIQNEKRINVLMGKNTKDISNWIFNSPATFVKR